MIGLILVVALIAVTTFYSLSALQQIYAEIELELKANEQNGLVVTNTQVAAFRRSDAVQALLMEDDPFEIDRIYMEFLSTGYQVGQGRNKIRSSLTKPEEIKVINRQDKAIEAVVELHDQLADLVRAERQQEALVLFRQQVVGLQATINATFQRLRELQQENSAKLSVRAAQQYQEVWRNSIKLILGSLLISILVSYWLYRFGGQQISLVQNHIGNLRDIANRDSLTGLLNRAGLFTQLNKLVERSEELSMLYMDLDGFKPINDHHGHVVGDYFLQMAAKRIQSSLRSDDEIARIGGDEFVTLLMGDSSQEVAERIAQSILQAFEQPFVHGGVEVDLGISIGIATCDAGNCQAESLLLKADKAMYKAKQDGRGRYSVSAN